MTETSSGRSATWNPADASPLGWILVGVLVAAVGVWVEASAHALGLALVGLGALPALVGVVAYGVEIGTRRAR
jgi:hypothetical protein